MTTSNFYDFLCLFLIGVPAMLLLLAFVIAAGAGSISKLADSVSQVADAIEGKNKQNKNDF